MANLSAAGGGGRFSDQRQLAKRLEKSNFAQTCSLLSQFLKEKRGLADLSPDVAAPRKKPRDESEKLKPSPPSPPPPTTVITDNSSDATRQQQKDNLPAFVRFPPSGFSINKGEFRRPATPEPATGQMTIFYAGKVLVYDDFPNERAKEIMALADKGSRRSTATATATSTPPAAAVAAATAATNIFGSALEKPNCNSPAVEPTVVAKTQAPVPEQQLKPQSEVKKSSDLPIARRASLHRFLEKRKDRAVVGAPYQVNQQPETAFKATGSSSGEPEHNREVEEGFPRHLDLNL